MIVRKTVPPKGTWDAAILISIVNNENIFTARLHYLCIQILFRNI